MILFAASHSAFYEVAATIVPIFLLTMDRGWILAVTFNFNGPTLKARWSSFGVLLLFLTPVGLSLLVLAEFLDDSMEIRLYVVVIIGFGVLSYALLRIHDVRIAGYIDEIQRHTSEKTAAEDEMKALERERNAERVQTAILQLNSDLLSLHKAALIQTVILEGLLTVSSIDVADENYRERVQEVTAKVAQTMGQDVAETLEPDGGNSE